MLPVIEIALPVQTGGNVPAFLAKLWKMVDNPDAGDFTFLSISGSETISLIQFIAFQIIYLTV